MTFVHVHHIPFVLPSAFMTGLIFFSDSIWELFLKLISIFVTRVMTKLKKVDNRENWIFHFSLVANCS